MAGIWQLALKSWRLTAVMAGMLYLTACGGSDPTPRELQARLDLADGAVAFDALAISGEAGTPGNTSARTVRLTLDKGLIFSSAGGSFSFTLDLARIPAGMRTLTLEVQEADGRRATVTRAIDVRGHSPRFQRIKAIEGVTQLSSVASNGRIALASTGCGGGGRYCLAVTTVDPDTPLTRLTSARFGQVAMNPDWTWFWPLMEAAGNTGCSPRLATLWWSPASASAGRPVPARDVLARPSVCQ